VAPVLQAELAEVVANERNAEQIAGQVGWLALQQSEVSRLQLQKDQLVFLKKEADEQLSQYGKEEATLAAQINHADEIIRAAERAGDLAQANRNAEVSAAGRVAWGHLPSLIAEATAHRDNAARELVKVESDLAAAVAYVRQATDEISRIEALSGTGVPWDAPASPVREIPSGLGPLGEWRLRQIVEDNQALLTEPLFRMDGAEIRPRDPKPKSWKNDLGKGKR
jgi:hypothetical protein